MLPDLKDPRVVKEDQPVAAEGADSSVIDLSVIIVNWNTRDILRNCLTSLFSNMEGLTTEVHVVDNGSTDGSPQMVRTEFPLARLIQNSENRGFAAANNQALRVSRGRYLLLLNSDTVVLGQVLRSCQQYMEEHPKVGVMGCQVLNADGSVQETCMMFPSLVNLFLGALGLSRLPWPRSFGREYMRHWRRDSEREVDVVTGCFMFARRTALEEVGLLDEGYFFYAEETDWCKRFWRRGWEVRFAPVGQIVHHGKASALQLGSARGVYLVTGILRFLRKHRGVAAAAGGWVLLGLFLLLRGVLWGLMGLGWTRRAEACRKKAAYNFAVLAKLGHCWPGKEVKEAEAREASWVAKV